MGFLKKFKNVLGSDKDRKEKPEDSIKDIGDLNDLIFKVVTEDDPKASLERQDNSEGEEIEEEPFDESLRNFRYLDHLIHGESKDIVLDSDIVLDDDERSRYSSMIELDVDDLVIDGNGHAIDARGMAGIFYVTGKNVTISNITLKNASTRAEGGALLNEGELKILNSALFGNSSDDGAAINNFGKLEIIDTTIFENRSTYGAAIFNEGGELEIIDSNLSGNHSKKHGGAIYNSSKLSIKSSTFLGNTADAGGAIYNSGDLEIIESNFRENSADTGGAIHNNLHEASITDSSFSSNRARIGGVISNESHTKLFGCEIIENSSQYNAIYNRDSLEINNTSIKRNDSFHTIYNDDNAVLTISYGSFEGNANMAVINNLGKSCSINSTAFEDNLSQGLNSRNILNYTDLTLIRPKINDEGKTLLNEGHLLIKNPSPDFENSIDGNGEVEIVGEIEEEERFDFGYLDRIIHESESREIFLEADIAFENYERDYYEGGIELDVDGMVIDGNGRTIDGRDLSRIFIVTADNITLRNIVFMNGHSHRNYDNPLNNNGGAFRINHGIRLTVENCEFINNISEDEGGAIHNNGLELNIIDSTLSGNKSENIGGVISNGGGDLNVISSSFLINSSKQGGAISNRDGQLAIKRSRFTSNSASEGGGIWNVDGSLAIFNTSFISNSSSNGGAIYDNRGHLAIKESLFSKNIAEKDGGAIYSREASFEICHSKFSLTTAKERGGSIFMDHCQLTIGDSTFSENEAQKSGGAIFSDCGKVIASQSEISANKAGWCGGFIYLDGGILNISQSSLKGNAAMNDYGGAIHNSRGDVEISDSTLSDNSAEEYGGAIHTNGGSLNLIDSSLSNNSAKFGGAIYSRKWGLYASELNWSNYEEKYVKIGSMNTEGEIILTRVALRDNVAREDGGAVCSQAGFDSVECDFSNNRPNDACNG